MRKFAATVVSALLVFQPVLAQTQKQSNIGGCSTAFTIFSGVLGYDDIDGYYISFNQQKCFKDIKNTYMINKIFLSPNQTKYDPYLRSLSNQHVKISIQKYYVNDNSIFSTHFYIKYDK